MEKLKMGVLGTSEHYFKRLAGPLKASTLFEPWAIASRSREKAADAAGTWGFAAAYGSYQELLDDPKIDFVYIPLPNHLHLEWIKRAADAGKAILCEKPLALNAREAREAASYCELKGVPLMEAFMYPFHPQWPEARRLITSGALGRLNLVNTLFFYNNQDPSNIRNIADVGGGALLDIGCYAVSSARFLMGSEPLRVLCSLERDLDFGTDILTSAILDFGEGRRATFTVGTQQQPLQGLDAVGSKGALHIEIPFNMGDEGPARLFLTDSTGFHPMEAPQANQYLVLFDAFARSLREKGPLPTPISDAIANMAVLDALFASSRSGTWEEPGRG